MGVTGSHSSSKFTQIFSSVLLTILVSWSCICSSQPLAHPHTWVVPAASSGAAPPPLALVQRGAPFLQLAVLQGVGRQVADLQAGELTQEVAERHPERWR